MITKQESRSIIRQAVKRVPEGEEIRHLNIMPMMDIVTILLVAFLVIAAESSAAVELNTVELPTSQSLDPPPELAEVVTISTEAILVGGDPFLPVLNGDVDQSKKKDGALGLTIPELSQFLGFVRKKSEDAMRAAGKEPPALPELVIIADKAIPFKLLYEVIASSRTEEAGYRRFRLLVLERQ
jgi:biopolymer transport protein ExbD